MRRLLALPALILVCSLPAFAQAPQTPNPPPEPPPRLEATGQFTFLATSGNASTQSLGTGGDFAWRPTPWTYTGKAIFAQNESNDELTARSISTLFRASRAIDARLSAYGQYDFLRNVFAGIEQRHVVEGGLSYMLVNAEPQRLRFDAGLGYLHEERPTDTFDGATLSLAAAYRLAFSTTSALTYEPRFLLPIAETGDWKFDQDVALTVALNTILSLKLMHTLRYANDPPSGFEKTDKIMAVSLVAKVKRPQK
jgi:putative salt-induced outer membrane protein